MKGDKKIERSRGLLKVMKNLEDEEEFGCKRGIGMVMRNSGGEDQFRR